MTCKIGSGSPESGQYVWYNGLDTKARSLQSQYQLPLYFVSAASPTKAACELISTSVILSHSKKENKEKKERCREEDKAKKWTWKLYRKQKKSWSGRKEWKRFLWTCSRKRIPAIISSTITAGNNYFPTEKT